MQICHGGVREKIGADAYAKDAVEVIRETKEMLVGLDLDRFCLYSFRGRCTLAPRLSDSRTAYMSSIEALLSLPLLMLSLPSSTHWISSLTPSIKGSDLSVGT